MKVSISQSPLNFTLSYPRKFLRFILFLGASVSIFYSLAWESSLSIRTLWVLDTSLSMVTQDVVGEEKIFLSRFDIAKRIILSGTVDTHGENALLTFDDVARLQLPFSSDTDILHSVVRGIEPVIYGGATDVSVALSSIVLIYPHEAFHVVLLTDGENSGTGGVYPEFPTGMQFSIIGIGTTEGGPMLQGYDADGKPRYKQYEGGNAISRLDRDYLSTMSENYQGDYYEVANIRNIESLAERIATERGNPSSSPSSWFLYVGIVLFITALLLKPYKMLEKSKTKNKN